MNALGELVKRNIKIYLRDKGAVFFSLLSMVIVIALMLFFLGDMNVDAITGVLSGIPGRDSALDEKNAVVYVLQWTSAGILAINAVTVTLAVYSAMIKDRAQGILNSIYTAPVSRLVIAAGYIMAAWICSVIICILTLIIAEIYCITQGAAAYTAMEHLTLLCYIGVNSFTYAALMYLVACLAKTEGAWSGLGTIIGTLVGFLGGIYLPIGSLADGIAMVMKCLPTIYGAKIFRNIMTKGTEELLFGDVPEALLSEYRLVMGVDLEFAGVNVEDVASVIILVVCGAVFLLAGVLVTKYMRKSDR